MDHSNKGNPLEGLTKEEIIEKHKRLQGLAQKLKQSKEECTEELKKSRQREEELKLGLQSIGEWVETHLDATYKNEGNATLPKDDLLKVKTYLDRSNMIIDAKEKEVQALHGTLTKLNAKLSDFELQRSEDAEKLSDFKQLYAKLDDDKRALESQTKELSSKLRKAEEKYTIVDQKLVEFQDKYLEEKKQHAKLQTLLEKLEEKSDRSERSESRDSLPPVIESQEMEAMCEKLHETNAQLDKLEFINQQFKLKCNEAEQLKEQLRKVEKENETLTDSYNIAINRLRLRFNGIEESVLKLSGFVEKAQSMKTKYKQQSKRLLELENSNKVLEKKVKKVSSSDDLQEQLNSLAEEKRLLDERLAEKIEELKSLSKLKDDCVNEKADMLVKIEEIPQLRLENENLHLKMDDLNRLLQESLLEKTRIEDHCRVELEKMKKEVENMKTSSATSSETSQELEHLRHRSIELEKIREELEQSLTVIPPLRLENENLRLKVDELNRLLEESLLDKNRIEDHCRVELDKMRKETAVETAAISTEEVENLRHRLVELEKTRQELETSLTEQCTKLENERDDLIRRIESLNSENLKISSESEERISALQETNSRLVTDAHDTENLHSINSTLREQLDKNNETFEKFREEVSNTEQKYKDDVANASEKYTSLMVEHEKLLEELKSMSSEKTKQLLGKDEEIAALKDSNSRLISDGQKVENLNSVISSLNKQLEEVRGENERADSKYNEMAAKLAESNNIAEGLEVLVRERCEEYDSIKGKIEEFDVLKKKVSEYDAMVGQLQRLWKDMSNVKTSFKNLQSGVALELTSCKDNYDHFSKSISQVVREFVQKLIEANSELLSEMNMMNQALKERGESISQMEEELATLRTNFGESEGKIKKLSERLDGSKGENEKLRSQLEIRDKTIREMEEDIWRLRRQDSSADTLSTSTISKVEESARLVDIEEGFEDRYNKLKIIAVKLKKKVAELQGQVEQERNKLIVERGEFEAKITQFQTQARTLNALQSDYDKLMDQSAADRKDMNELRRTLDKAREESVALKKNAEEMKQDRERFKQEKMSFDIIKKELSGQIQALKKAVEKEQNKVKEFDAVREKYEQDLRVRDKRLEEESDKHKATLATLEEQRMEQKKHSLLSLEMADYEKTVTDLSRKLKAKEGQARELESSLETQRELSKSLQEQIMGLEARVAAEQQSADTAKLQATGLQDSTLELRAEIASKEALIADLERSCQQTKLVAEQHSLESAALTTEKAKMEERARTAQEALSRDLRAVEDKLQQQQELLVRKDLELSELRQEFESYKVRAQSVLRQSQKELPNSRQHDIEEEVQLLRNTSDAFKTKMEDAVRRSQVLQDEIQAVTEEKSRHFQKVQELMASLAEMRAVNTELQAAERKAREEGEENARVLRVQMDTLAQCFKKEIEDLKTNFTAELEASRTAYLDVEKQLHLHVDTGHKRTPSVGKMHETTETSGHKRQSSANFIPVKSEREMLDVLMLEREACEGSESVDSTSPRLVPLDQLLAPHQTGDVSALVERLDKSENRIQHLTDLLSDAESDAARLQQLNEVLKEEIRRKERNEAREQHAHNLEYLKNIVIKFSTLPKGDERLRLVPVLNTILKLSPEEEARLSNAARGGIDGQGWGSYLGGMWSTTQ